MHAELLHAAVVLCTKQKAKGGMAKSQKLALTQKSTKSVQVTACVYYKIIEAAYFYFSIPLWWSRHR